MSFWKKVCGFDGGCEGIWLGCVGGGIEVGRWRGADIECIVCMGC